MDNPWNTESLKNWNTRTSVLNMWNRVAEFDLPQEFIENNLFIIISLGPSKSSILTIILYNKYH